MVSFLIALLLAYELAAVFFVTAFVNLIFWPHHGVATAIKFSIRKKTVHRHCLKHKKLEAK